jgi:hypothetical protein
MYELGFMVIREREELLSINQCQSVKLDEYERALKEMENKGSNY